MRDLAPAEHHGQLDLVPLLQELTGVPRLELEIVLADSRPVLHFLHLDDVLLLSCCPRGLGLLEPVLPVVHDLDHRRTSRRGYLHEIQPLLACRLQRIAHRYDTDLGSILINQPHGADPNLVIDSDPLSFILNSQ